MSDEIDQGFTHPSVPSTPLEPAIPTVPSTPLEPAQLTTLGYFRAMFPEFVAYEDRKVSLQLEFAKPLISEDAWGESYKLGLSLIAAHRLVLSSLATNADGSINLNVDKDILSKSVGGVSLSYNAAAPTNAMGGQDRNYWSSTPYGRQYMTLRDLFGVGALVL